MRNKYSDLPRRGRCLCNTTRRKWFRHTTPDAPTSACLPRSQGRVNSLKFSHDLRLQKSVDVGSNAPNDLIYDVRDFEDDQ